MREIKFKQGRKNIHGEINWEYFTLKSGVVFDVCLYGDTPILQFTGLTDKNKKEIYEGDILKIDSWKWVVKYKTLKLSQDGLGIGFNIADRHEFNNGNVEVIGNIYENPELLEEKE